MWDKSSFELSSYGYQICNVADAIHITDISKHGQPCSKAQFKSRYRWSSDRHGDEGCCEVAALADDDRFF